MHPPSFRRNQLLSDWPDCFIEARCKECQGRSTVLPVKLLLQRHGDRSFTNLLGRLKCEECGQRPGPVYLCASHFRQGGHGGPSPDWAVEIQPEQSPLTLRSA